MKRLIVLCLLFLVPVNSFAYNDVSEDFWAYSAIKSLSEEGILTGYPDNTFKPESKMTTAEFITVLTKILGLNADVSGGSEHWADKNIEAVKRQGMLDLTEYEKFNPDKNITRFEICKMVINSFNATKNAEYRDVREIFKDISEANKEEQKIARILNSLGILNGYPDGTVKFQNTSTRAEVSQFICSLKKNLSELASFCIEDNVIYEGNIAVETFKDKAMKLRKYQYAEDSEEYCTTIIKNIEVFKFEDALNTQYKEDFQEVFYSDIPYFEFRRRVGSGKYVMAIEFTTRNNTEKFGIPAGYEFLQISFPTGEEISISDAFDTDEFIRQKNKNGAVGEVINPGEIHNTSAFYVLDKAPQNKVEVSRSLTALIDTAEEKIVRANMFHSLIIYFGGISEVQELE